MTDCREQVVRVALNEVGKSDPFPYWRDVADFRPPYPKSWCGAFCLWCLHQAGLAEDWSWKIGRGFLYRLKTTRSPLPGDVAYFTKFQHQAIIRDVDELGQFRLVNGNGTGGRVTLGGWKPKKSARAFYSIARLISEVSPDK